MIGFLQGTVFQIDEESVILNVRGVGYELLCSQNTVDVIKDRDVVQLLVHTHVREDIIQLFGFVTATEKQLFLSLIKVSGIGPKMAIKILSATRIELLVEMIDSGDVKALVKLPKVGKKTAEQIILSLKGKLVLADDSLGSEKFIARAEIVSALVNLGFKLNDVETVVDQMEVNTDLQVGVRQGLMALTSQV